MKTALRALALALVYLGSAVSAEHPLIKILNGSLGQSLVEFQNDWPGATMDNNGVYFFDIKRTYQFPGMPARSVTTESGRVGEDGRWSGVSRTTSVREMPAETFRWRDRLMFYLNSAGVVYRWEVRNAVGVRDEHDMPVFTISDAREMIWKGDKRKIVKVGKFRGML